MTNWMSSYLDIPFLDRGSDRKGCDCWGLIVLIYKEQLNVNLSVYAEIAQGDVAAKVDEITAAADGPDWTSVPANEVKEFDVVLMKGIVGYSGKKMARPIHVGIVTKPGFLVHIESGCEVVVADYRSHPMLRRRIVGFYRFKRMQ